MTTACAFFLAFLASPASALWFNGGVKQTAGSGGYRGTSLNMTVGQEDYTFKPAYSMYESDNSGGVFRSLGGRMGYDSKTVGVGVSAGGTNKVDGYENRYVGADVTFSLSPGGKGSEKRIDAKDDSAGPARGKGVARVDIGGEFRATRHSDQFFAQPGTRNKIALRNNGRTFEIDQFDVTGSLGVSVLNNLLSVATTKTKYDKDIRGNQARASQFMRMRGIGPVVSGFPDTSLTGRLETSMLPMVTPYVQYTRTRFAVGQPDSHDTALGAYVELGVFEASATYETYSQAGSGVQNYFTGGGSLRF